MLASRNIVFTPLARCLTSLCIISMSNVDKHLGGGGQRGLKFPPPVPFDPGSRPIFVGSHLFALCIIFPICPASRPLFFRPPYTSRPSSPGSRPLVPIHQTIQELYCKDGVTAKDKNENSPSCVHVLHKTLNFVISSCSCA